MTETPEATTTSKGGAPALNRNRTTWGGRGWAAIGSYPKGAAWVRRQVGRMRVELEAAVCAAHGEVGVYESALIQSACRHEGRALLLTRWLRLGDATTLAERLAVLREIGAATDSRDKCLKGLGLDSPHALDPWAAIDAPGAWQEHPDGMHETASTAPEDPPAASGRDETPSHQSEVVEPNTAGDAAPGSQGGASNAA